MTARLRERPLDESPAEGARRLAQGDGGVSPVVGMILVLAISIVGIAAILYWGLPTIDEMKANVEFRSVQTQFTELDATMKELVAGTTDKTAKRWQPSISRGEVAVKNNTQPWLYAVTTRNASASLDFDWYGFGDDDQSFHVHYRNQSAAGGITRDLWLVKVEAYLVTGTTTQTTLNVTGGTALNDDQMTGANLIQWSNNTAQTFRVWVKDAATPTAQPLKEGTYKFRVYSGSALLAEAWFIKTGSVDFHLNAGVGSKSVVENNGAVIAGTNGQYVIVNTPPVPPPAETAGVPRHFIRALVVGGNASFAGEDRFDLLITLYSTSTLASYDCAKTDGSDCVSSVKLYALGTMRAPWYQYLTNAGRGYTFAEKTDSVTGTVHLLDQRDRMAFTLLASNVEVKG